MSSTPTGANIYLNNEYKGLTPLTMNNIANGNHIVIVKLSGYQDWTQNVIVLGNSTSLTATLVTSTATTTTTPAVYLTNGSIYFSSTPEGAVVFVDSVKQGSTPFTFYNVTPGSYVIKIQRASYLEWADRVTVTSGNQTKVSAKLTAVDSSTTQTTSPTIDITTATLPPTTVKSTQKAPTPWPSATPTQESSFDPIIMIVAICAGIILIKRH